MRSGIRVAVLTAAAVTVPAFAGETELDYGVTVMAGHDSNPLEVSTEADDQPGAGFGHLKLDGSVSHTFKRSFTLFADGDAVGRFHSGESDADFSNLGARAGMAYSPNAAPRFLVGFGGRYSQFRTTYIDRATGEIYDVLREDAQSIEDTVEIPDRLDNDASELFLNLRWKQNSRLRFFLDTRLRDVGYVEDYAEETTLEPLDFSALSLEPGVSASVHDAVRVIFSVTWTDLDYDERSAIDSDGFRVPDETRSYEYTTYRLTVRARPGTGWNLSVGARVADRSDVYAGYYDYGSMSSYVSLERELGEANRVRFAVSYSDLEYDDATVTGDPQESTLDEKQVAYLTRFERSFHQRSRWFVEGGIRETDSRDPDFTFDGEWFLVGVELRR